MKTILATLLLILFSSLMLTAETDNYKLFLDAYNKKDNAAALKYIEKAYEKNPETDYIIYWYGYMLYSAKKYEEAANVLSKLPILYQTYSTQWYLIESYIKTEKNDKAIAVCERALKQPDGKEKWHQHIYYKLIDLLIKKDDFKKVRALEKPLLDYYESLNKPNDEIYFYIKYLFCKYYNDKIMDKLASLEGSIDESLYESLNKIDKMGLGKYKSFLDTGNIKTLVDISDYWEKNYEQKKNTSQKHKILVVVFKNLDSEYADKNGQKKYVKNTLPDDFHKQYEKAMNIFAKIYFYHSEGKLLIEYTTQYSDSTIKDIKYSQWVSAQKDSAGKPLGEVDIYSPMLETISPNPHKIFFDNRKAIDTFIVIFPSDNITSISTGGLGKPIYVPNYFYDSSFRGWITLASTSAKDPMGYAHEFFHIIEGAYIKGYPFITHAFREGYRSYWPKWFSGGGELVYQKKAFENVIIPQGIDKLKLAVSKDSYTNEVFNQKNEKLVRYSLSQIKKAKDLFNEANTLYWQKNNAQALKLFLRVLEIMPDYPQALEMTSIIYSAQNDFTKALEYYKKFVETENPSIATFSKLGYYYEKTKNLDESYNTYLKAHTQFRNDASFLYQLGRLAYQIKNYPNSLKYYQQYLSHPEKDSSLIQFALNLCVWMLVYQEKDYQRAVDLSEKHYENIKETSLKASIAAYTGIAYSNLENKEKALKWISIAKEKGFNDKKLLDFYIKKNQK